MLGLYVCLALLHFYAAGDCLEDLLAGGEDMLVLMILNLLFGARLLFVVIPREAEEKWH